MKKRIFSILIVLALCLTMLPTAALADNVIEDLGTPQTPETNGAWTGTDDSGNPYYDISWYTEAEEGTETFTLSDAADLAGLAVIVNGLYKVTGQEDWFVANATMGGGTLVAGNALQDDFAGKTITLADDAEIDLSGKTWTPIGSSKAKPFSGTFDGNSAIITNLTINNVGPAAGLLGHVENGTIRNVTIKDANITVSTTSNNTAVGTVAACVYGTDDKSATVKDCKVEGTTITANYTSGVQLSYMVGGIVGANGCAVDNGGTITYYDRNKSTVENCTFSGTIQSQGKETGGIVGHSGGSVKNCTNNGSITVSSSNSVGGIVGRVEFSSNTGTTTIEGCVNKGTVTNSYQNSSDSIAGGILGEILTTTTNNAGSKVTIEKCSNLGAVNSDTTAGGILGKMTCSSNDKVEEVKISQCYNAAEVTTSKRYTTGAGGLIGILSFANGGTVTVENCYNVGDVSGGQNNTGGLLGYATLLISNTSTSTAGTLSFTSCYNAGNVTGHNSYTGGIVGRNDIGDSLTLINCNYYNYDGLTGNSYGTGKTANQMTEDSTWSTNLGLSANVWEKTANDLSDKSNLIGYLPVLTSNEQAPAPTLTRTAKTDQEALTVSGVPDDKIYEDKDSFTLSATGGSVNGAVTWTSNNSDVATVDSGGKVTITGVGVVTITATKAGDDTYNDTSASVDFTVYGKPITEVTILNLEAPVQGANPVQYINVPENANYGAQTALGVGGKVLDVTWTDSKDQPVSTFAKGEVYTAAIRLKADEYYSFGTSVTATLDNIQESAYSSTVTLNEDGTVTVKVFFNATTHTHSWSEDWISNATHHWHACLNDDCPLTESGMEGYAEHIDGDNDGICDICNTTIGYEITFDANGGTCDMESVHTNVKGLLSDLPTPTRSGYNFGGWFTAAEGGDQVTDEMAFSADTTVYAHWTAIPTSGSSSSSTRYPVTVEDSAHGQVESNRTSAKRGETVTITPKPDSGYEVDSVTVTDKNGKTVKVTDNGDGTYSFTQPASKVTVEVTFAEIQTPVEQLPFMDVPESAYYYDAVAWAVENGVTSGTSAITFSPDAPCTRAQSVTFLWRAAGSPAPKSSVNPFADVSTGDYYYDAVLWAVENGITAGTSATTFSPNDTCTRAQIVTFLYRAEGTLRAGNNPFADVADSAYYYNAVLWAVKSGVTAGTSATTFSPDAPCTRAQIVTFLYRVYAD